MLGKCKQVSLMEISEYFITYSNKSQMILFSLLTVCCAMCGPAAQRLLLTLGTNVRGAVPAGAAGAGGVGAPLAGDPY